MVFLSISYRKLWHLLLDKNMKKMDLKSSANLTSHAMYKLSKNESVQAETLAKICKALDCKMDDIVEFTDDEE